MDPGGIKRYIISALANLEGRGFEVPGMVDAVIDDTGALAFSVTGTCPEVSVGPVAEVRLDEVWQPIGVQLWERSEYAYDLVDRPMNRRRAWHMHAVRQSRAALGSPAHEHCEEVLGRPPCDHYLGMELRDIHEGIALIDGAWMEPGPLGCGALMCA